VGSAKASGATVTIIGGGVDVRADITVPAGVTLDVTAEDAKLSLHNVTLTVNGTVNADPGRIRLEDTADWGTLKGSGTIRLTGKGSLFVVEGNKNRATRTLTLDGVTLVGLEDNNESLVLVNGDPDKGYKGEFVLKSGAITGNTHTSDSGMSGGGVKVREGGEFIMEGGEISGNTAAGEWASGGGVAVEDEGTFTMKGGRISGNHATGQKDGQGGGVQVYKGTFTMEGGEIAGNTASVGGGVQVNESTFTMSGGTIYGNIAQGTKGGGVNITNNSTFTMSGGAIYDNIAQDESNGNGDVGGVNVSNSTFTMSGGEIYGNTAEGDNGGSGGGVQVNNSVFTMNDGAIYGNTAPLGGGIEAYGSSTFTMNGGRIQGNSDSDGFTKNTGTDRWAALHLSNNPTATFGPGGGKVGSTGKGSNTAIDDSGNGTDETIIAPQ
jgi:hypothetical protein